MGSMVVVWEGRVAKDKQADLIDAYRRSADNLPPQMTRHALAQDADDPEVWRVFSFWRSPAALEEYRSSAETPAALLMFRAAGTEPTRSVSEAVLEGSQ